MKTGTVYTETIVHLAPARFADDVPYQVAIITLEDGERLTARIQGERVQIGDLVTEVEPATAFPCFRKS